MSPVRLLGAILLAVLPASSAAAHDLPNDVTIHLLAKVEGARLVVLVRAPMAAMQDIDYPRDRQGMLDLPRGDASLGAAAALWLVPNLAVEQDGAQVPAPAIVAARVSLPSDRSFASWDEASAHLAAPPLAADARLPWEQGLLDVRVEYAVTGPPASLAIVPTFARLGIRTLTVLRVVLPGGTVRAFEFAGDPGPVPLELSWWDAARRFVRAGFDHILDGTDHLLFLLCLVIPVRRLRPLVLVVTAFALAHSVTLVAAAFGVAPGALWFPPLVETLIAASIVYTALENIAHPEVPNRALVAFGFGLVHGFGFSFALRDTLQFAGTHLLASLLAFNVGVELGQLLVLVVLVPALHLLFRHVVAARIGTIILSALVAHTGWHWMVERWDTLRRFRFAPPVVDAAWLAGAARGLMLLAVIATLGWLIWERTHAGTKAQGEFH